MYQKNSIINGTVHSLGANGEGIVKKDDTVFFVPFALPDENIDFKILKSNDKIAFGKIEKLNEPSPFRITPKCGVFQKCGGCQLQHLEYEKQLEFKKQLVQNNLYKIGNINYNIKNCVASDNVFGYRNKLQLPVGQNDSGENVIGFYAERSHRIIPINDCPLHPDWAKEIISIMYIYMDKSGAKGYNEQSKSGLIRHIVVREIDKKFIITIVATKTNLPKSDLLIELLKSKFEEFTLIVNENKSSSNVIFSDKFFVIFGEGQYTAEEFGICFEAGANTFVQVNSNVRKKLYQKAVELACGDNDNNARDTVVIDAYSGGGLMTAMLAKKSKFAYGIEIVKEAVDCADKLKIKNNLSNKMLNICGKTEIKLTPLINKLKDSGEKVCLVLDPPRSGVDRAVILEILKSKPEKIVMISCNSATMARDLGLILGSLNFNDKGEIVRSTAYCCEKFVENNEKRVKNKEESLFTNENQTTNQEKATSDRFDKIFENELANIKDKNCENDLEDKHAINLEIVKLSDNLYSDYEIKFIQPFDMFPQTKHVETLCCLTLKETIKG